MPQLVKRGKYVFGWTSVNNNCSIRIPDEAYEEYKYTENDILILISGSRSSGGFSINRLTSVLNSKFGNNILQTLGYDDVTETFVTEHLETVRLANRLLCYTKMLKDRYFKLSETVIEKLDININDKLLGIRGSGVGVSFLSKGLIFNEALKHSSILQFD